ncbi:hypothetical protein D3C72_1465700 [compost metagenome]
MSHAFLACGQAVGMVHKPQAQVAEHGAPDRGVQADAGPAHGGTDQAEPEQRVVQGVGQELGVEVDEELADQHGAEGCPERARGGDAETVRAQGEQRARDQLDEGVAGADRGLAAGAPATQHEVAEHRDVLVPADLVAARAAARSGAGEVEGRELLERFGGLVGGRLEPCGRYGLRAEDQ